MSSLYVCQNCGCVMHGVAPGSPCLNCRSPLGGKPQSELEKEIVAAPIEGWRIWSLVEPENLTLNRATLAQMAVRHDQGMNPFRGLLGPKLQSVGVAGGFTWDTPEINAECRRSDPYATPYSLWLRPLPPQHPAPHLGCHCGIWALKDEKALWSTLASYNSSKVYGRVQMWGRIIEHAKGYRAEHARPLQLFLIGGDDEKTRDLADFYGCPVEGVSEPKEVEKARKSAAQNPYSQHVYPQALAQAQKYAARLYYNPTPVKKRRGIFRKDAP